MIKKLKNFLNENLKMDKIHEIAIEIFNLNYNNILNSEYEFCIGIYEKDQQLKTTKPIIGNDIEVDIPQFEGKLLALVHSHLDYLDLNLSKWDIEIGEDFANKNNEPFRIYIIGYDENYDLTMTYEEF